EASKALQAYQAELGTNVPTAAEATKLSSLTADASQAGLMEAAGALGLVITAGMKMLETAHASSNENARFLDNIETLRAQLGGNEIDILRAQHQQKINQVERDSQDFLKNMEL